MRQFTQKDIKVLLSAASASIIELMLIIFLAKSSTDQSYSNSTDDAVLTLRLVADADIHQSHKMSRGPVASSRTAIDRRQTLQQVEQAPFEISSAPNAVSPNPVRPTSPDLSHILSPIARCAAGHVDRLTEEQRHGCNARLPDDARRAPVIDGIPTEKCQVFDAVATAYAVHRVPMPVATGGVGTQAEARPSGPIPGGERWRPPEGAHLPSLRCTLVLGTSDKAHKAPQPPPHSPGLGPCALRPGAGVLTEEADIP